MCAVAPKGTNPVTEYIQISATAEKGIVLTTYDLEKGVRTAAEGEIEREGCYCVNANKLFQTLKVMESEEVSLEVSENLETTIRSGRSLYRMQALNGEVIGGRRVVIKEFFPKYSKTALLFQTWHNRRTVNEPETERMMKSGNCLRLTFIMAV